VLGRWGLWLLSLGGGGVDVEVFEDGDERLVANEGRKVSRTNACLAEISLPVSRD
jgi:hypothetical protein